MFDPTNRADHKTALVGIYMDERIPPQYGIHLMTDIVKKKVAMFPSEAEE